VGCVWWVCPHRIAVDPKFLDERHEFSDITIQVCDDCGVITLDVWPFGVARIHPVRWYWRPLFGLHRCAAPTPGVRYREGLVASTPDAHQASKQYAGWHAPLVHPSNGNERNSLTSESRLGDLQEKWLVTCGHLFQPVHRVLMGDVHGVVVLLWGCHCERSILILPVCREIDVPRRVHCIDHAGVHVVAEACGQRAHGRGRVCQLHGVAERVENDVATVESLHG
jgi:hypothetical protein